MAQNSVHEFERVTDYGLAVAPRAHRLKRLVSATRADFREYIAMLNAGANHVGFVATSFDR